jgi:hypothetical protein
MIAWLCGCARVHRVHRAVSLLDDCFNLKYNSYEYVFESNSRITSCAKHDYWMLSLSRSTVLMLQGLCSNMKEHTTWAASTGQSPESCIVMAYGIHHETYHTQILWSTRDAECDLEQYRLQLHLHWSLNIHTGRNDPGNNITQIYRGVVLTNRYVTLCSFGHV